MLSLVPSLPRTKLVQLLVWIILTFHLRLMSLLNASIKLSVLMLFVVLICTTLLDIYLNIAPQHFVCLRPSLTINGLNMSIPQNVKRGSWVSPSDGRSPIFCRQTFPLNCLEATHLDIIDFTALVQLMIQ